MTVADAAIDQIPHKRVTLHEPESGWSPEVYDRELTDYAAEFGRPPQTVTMHPDTAVALGLRDDLADLAGSSDSPLLVTSPEYARQEITLYY